MEERVAPDFLTSDPRPTLSPAASTPALPFTSGGETLQGAGRPVLLVGTSRDAVTPYEAHHVPLVKAYEAQRAARLEHHVFPSDHALSDHRLAPARTVVDFLGRSPVAA